MSKEKVKLYKCVGCKRETTILSVGDISIGCASCGGREGFVVKEGKGEWELYQDSGDSDRITRFLATGK